MPATLWITYAWADNQHGDIDFIAQELLSVGLNVKLDRWNIGAGKRLWDQIDDFISNPGQSDAWLLVATQTSLLSEPCKEEFAYALDRALRNRGEQFPVLALFPGSVDETLIPAGIRTRLYVSLTDADWKERIKAGVDRRAPAIARPAVEPYVLKIHRRHPSGNLIVEVRPRAGFWAPVFAAVPIGERESSRPLIMVEPAGVITGTGVVTTLFDGPSSDGLWWGACIQGQATPIQSLYVWLPELPTQLRFGVPNNGPVFTVHSLREKAA
jgi:hypothetical protein